jgi:3-oxoacyl-[acyl-carrier protein] reductase
MVLTAPISGPYANAIAPGPIRSRMTQDFGIGADAFPLGRIGQMEVVFLSSQASHWITGAVLHVNGGMYLP